MKYVVALAFILSAVMLSAAAPTWPEVEAEQDLEKQSRLALEYARAHVDAMVKAYAEGRREEGRAAAAEIVRAVELAKTSLDETGKHPRKKPKHFKHAEIATRKLIKDLGQAQEKLEFDDRPDLDPAIERIEEINRELLMGIMQPKSR